MTNVLSSMFLGEFLGTMMLIILGNGLVSNLIYKRTKGHNGGSIVAVIGWGLAVFASVLIANAWSTGGHLNPAVTVALWVKGTMSAGPAMLYIFSQLFGATVGQVVISAFYWHHANQVENKDVVLDAHCNRPVFKDKPFNNLFSEFLATVVLVTMALILATTFKDTADNRITVMNFIGPLTIGLTVMIIGAALGGNTGYSINPARDLMPRLVYQITPYKYKTSANWSYSWVPVVGPLAAGVIVGAFSRLMT